MTRQSLHGFASWVDFVKATLSLGTTIGVILWTGLQYAMAGLDNRYAPISLVDQIESNHAIAEAVRSEVREVRAKITAAEIFDLATRRCVTADQSTVRLIDERLAELEREYFRITGRDPRVPPCTTSQ